MCTSLLGILIDRCNNINEFYTKTERERERVKLFNIGLIKFDRFL